MNTLARSLVHTTKIETQTGQTGRREWINMPRAVGGRVHRTSLPTATTKPSSPRCIYTSHLTWTGKRAPSPRHGSCLRGQAAKHAVPLVVVVDGGSKQQGKQQCMLLCGREGGQMSVLRSVSKRTTKLFRTTPAAAPDRRLHKTHATPQNGGCAGAHCLVCQRADQKREEAGRA